jgi:HEAT repeat protein
MSDAIKDSESNDPDKRVLAEVILSYIGTREAIADLKMLAADSDPEVAEYATTRLSYGPDPSEYYRQVTEESVDPNRPPVIKH